MFSTSLYTCLLHALNRLLHRNTRQVRVDTEALPVPSSSGNLAERTSDGAKHDMDAELLCFLANECAAFADEVDVPSRCCVDTGGEGRSALNVAYTEGPVFLW